MADSDRLHRLAVGGAAAISLALGLVFVFVWSPLPWGWEGFDFYHERDGELVFLCFKLGESDITHWHSLAGGFAGREPL